MKVDFMCANRPDPFFRRAQKMGLETRLTSRAQLFPSEAKALLK